MERKLLSEILDELRETRREAHADAERQLQELRLIAAAITPISKRAVSLTYTLTLQGATMSQGATINVGMVATGTVTEWSGPNGTGSPVAPPGPKGIVFSSDNVAVATVDASGNVTGVSAGTANVTALDQDNGLTDTATVTVQGGTPPPPPPPPAQSMTYNLTAPASMRRA